MKICADSMIIYNDAEVRQDAPADSREVLVAYKNKLLGMCRFVDTQCQVAYRIPYAGQKEAWDALSADEQLQLSSLLGRIGFEVRDGLVFRNDHLMVEELTGDLTVIEKPVPDMEVYR